MEWLDIKTKIVKAMNELYDKDKCLFNRNSGRGLAERCVVFRFAYYLQNEFSDYFVDCDFNSSFSGSEQLSGKRIQNRDGTTTKRFVDIIIHKRDFNSGSGIYNDLVCFEIKKWNNKTNESLRKDRNNLCVLTSDYGYKYGFHIILGKNIGVVKIVVFERDMPNRPLTWDEFCEE